MSPKLPILLAACLVMANGYAQKRVLSYPFAFEKGFLARGDYDAYFLDNPANSTFALVLKDNKKMEYVLVDQNFKVASKFGAGIDNTVFGIKGLKDCTGGTANGNQYHFIYPESKTEYDMETVDFDTKAISQTLTLPELTLQEKKIDYSGLVPKDERGKVYVSSYLKGHHLFSLVLNKKNIRIVVNDAESGAMLNKIEINDDAALDQFADGPVAERRMGKKTDSKEVTDVKKLIKAFTRGTEGLMVSENKSGQLVITAGTYDLIQMSSGGGGPNYVGGWQPNTTGNLSNPGMVYNPYMYMRSATPSYTRTDARYYNTTYFRLLVDPVNFKVARGRVPQPVPDQIKDYIDTIDKKAKATNQFAMGKNQYYGYYDRDALAYVIEQIRLIQ